MLTIAAAGMSWPASAAAAEPTQPTSLPRVIRSTLQWTQGDLINVETAQAARANFVHTFPRPPKMRGLIPVPAQQEWLGTWSRQVAALHGAGIFVSASVGSTCFNPAIFRQHGLDPELYFARDESNQPSSMLGGAYGKELMSSCYANPLWIDLLTDNVLAFARAGFDGIWYDVGGYVDNAVMYCQCSHCATGWREHVAAVNGAPAVSLPTRTANPDYANWITREFLRWRVAKWIEWETKVKNAVRREYPRFAFAHNMGVKEGTDRGVPMFIHATTDVFDYVHWEEWGHGTAPYSDIPSYLLGVAVGRGKPVMLVQNDKPPRNPLQHRIYLAEGYASGGSPEFGTRHAGNSRGVLDFISKNEDLYAGGESMANVAVLYSGWSQAVYAFPAKRWPAQWMGQLLLDRHVPFDYVIAERDLHPAALEKYRTLVVPDVGCLSDAQAAAIRSFVEQGGTAIITGESGVFDEEMRRREPSLIASFGRREGAESARMRFGRGRVAVLAGSPEEDYWRRNSRDFARNAMLTRPLPLPAPVAAAFDWAFGGTLPLEVDAPATTAVLSRRQAHRLLVHLVNYDVYPDGKELQVARGIRITLALPAGAAVSNVEVVSPDFEGRRRIAGWKVEGGSLRFTVDELGVYAVVTVQLRE